MFTMLDLADAKKELYKNCERPYAPQKNELSYELSEMSGTDRGHAIEIMVAKLFQKNGMEVELLSGMNDYDMRLFVNGQIIRVEIKSSLKCCDVFKFQGIKPEYFDLLVFAFVDPVLGVVIKTVDGNDFWAWAQNKKSQKQGYDFRVNDTMNHKSVQLTEWAEDGSLNQMEV